MDMIYPPSTFSPHKIGELIRPPSTNHPGAQPAFVMQFFRRRNDDMLHIVYNPTAGKGKSERFHAIVEKRLWDLKIDHIFHKTQHRSDAIEIVRTLTRDSGDSCMDIIAMGGDGTLNEVLNGIENPEKVRLGLIPCGSGNDFAGMAGIPCSAEGALDIILKGNARFTDFLECSGKRGINAIGTGIDVDILKRRSKARLLKGSACYLVSLTITVITYKSKQFCELINGKAVPHCALIACAANGQRIGGGIHVCPEASIDDGQLDILIIDNLKKYQLPKAFAMLLSKRILAHPHAVFRRADSLKLESNSPMPIQIDGEIYENLPFDVHVVHNKLKMYRP